VMEHLPNPRNFVKICYDLLEPGGLFCTVVANDYSPIHEILRNMEKYPPWWLDPPTHLNYFSIQSLEKLVTSVGFESLNVTTTFPMEFFLLMGDNYVGDEKLGKICHKKRKKFEFAFENAGLSHIRKQMYKNFAELNIGRDIDFTFKKPKI